MLHTYTVGDLYHPDRTDWPETPQYNFRGGQHELVLFYRNPSRPEIRGARKSPLDLALVVELPLILLLFRAPKLTRGWSDAPFSWHLVGEDERSLPPDLVGEQRPLLHLILVRANGGQLLAQRALTLPPDFAQALHGAIREQASIPWNRNQYLSRLDQLYAQYPRTDDLLKLAVARGRAGT